MMCSLRHFPTMQNLCLSSSGCEHCFVFFKIFKYLVFVFMKYTAVRLALSSIKITMKIPKISPA